jgi:hypothetical protein
MIAALTEPFVSGIGIGLGIGVVLVLARMLSDFLLGLFEKDDEPEE